MAEVNYPHGAFCWWELATTDSDSARSFYGELFGWQPVEAPLPEGAGSYTLLQKDGLSAAALTRMQDDMLVNGIPPHWNSYVRVDNADATVNKVLELNGSVLAGPFDVMDQGRMAVIQDPTGAMVSIWEPKAHRGADLNEGPGCICWTELATPNAAAAGEFYAGIFNWDLEAMPMGSDNYVVLKSGDQSRGGMMEMNDEWAGIPPHWMPYIWVEDTSATATTAARLGADIVVPPQDIPGIGIFAVIKDPQGAVFSILGPGAEN